MPPNEANLSPVPVVSWFKAHRAPEALEMIKANPNTFILLYVIAYRARWYKGFNAYELEPGEAMLGDYNTYGMSERQYRTAKEQLERWKFATFRTTNRGTIAKIMDTRVFSVLNNSADRQNDGQTTNNQRTTARKATTNVERKELKDGKTGGKSIPPGGLESMEQWKLDKDIERLRKLLQTAKESQTHDRDLIAADSATLNRLLDEKRRRGHSIRANRPSVQKVSVPHEKPAISAEQPKKVNIHDELTPEKRAEFIQKLREVVK